MAHLQRPFRAFRIKKYVKNRRRETCAARKREGQDLLCLALSYIQDFLSFELHVLPIVILVESRGINQLLGKREAEERRRQDEN